MQFRRGAGLSLAAVLVVLCGCSGSGPGAPTALSYSVADPVFIRGIAVTPDTPASSGGSVTSYAVDPALPAGLTLSSSTGIVSGTPTAVAPKASYTVTASGAGGSTTTTLAITVNDQAPATFGYAGGTVIYVVGTPITPNGPANSGGSVVSYSISPALPAGLTFTTSTGIISGDPAAVSPATNYTVTATNSGGAETATVNITVNPAAAAVLEAPAGLTYSTPNAVYTVGVRVPENYPTSTGGPPLTYYNAAGTKVYAYTVSPALPPGLYLSGSTTTVFGDNGTGVISGVPQQTITPAAPYPAAPYTITASNSAGSTTTTLTIQVNAADPTDPADQPPSGLAYSFPAPVYVAGVQITPDTPVANPTIGSSSTYSINPPLPAGLSFDPGSGAITGIPAAVPSTIVPPPYTPAVSSPQPTTATYTVTATNSLGGTTAPVTITIYNSPQSVPNLAQSITPLAITGSNFQFLDTGMTVTDSFNPEVAPVEWMAGQAVSTAVSPDGTTLLVLTSGFNRVFQGPFPIFDPLYSTEYIFVFDITGNSPVFKQAIPVPNAYHGIVWDPVAPIHTFYVSGGMGDAPFGTDPIPYPLPNNGDNIHIVQQQADGTYKPVAELDLGQDSSNVAAGHPSGNGLPVPNNQFASVNSAVFVAPMAAGLAISPDGNTLIVANYYNDSITIFTGGLSIWQQQWLQDPTSAQGYKGFYQGKELDLRPGKAVSSPAPGTPGGEYPFWVVFAGNSGPGRNRLCVESPRA